MRTLTLLSIAQRSRIIDFPPERHSAIRMPEISEVWQEKLYFDMTDYHEWSAERKAMKERTKAA
ncbi:MAG TPA: hypothetical protein VKT72_11915 [Candidatus Baltobacteraceae bacterium]|nr:hypothetical protein [Candidatus Baltobacteraceae bacterium]